MTRETVRDFLVSCLMEAEADGYQQQENDAIHDHPIEFFSVGDSHIFIRVGDEEFRVTVSKPKKQ